MLTVSAREEEERVAGAFSFSSPFELPSPDDGDGGCRIDVCMSLGEREEVGVGHVGKFEGVK